MEQFKIAILLIMVSILLCACPKKEDGHNYITFVNKSPKDIRFDFLIGDSNSLWICNEHNILFFHRVWANSSFQLTAGRYALWEKVIDGEIVNVFIIDDETFYPYRNEPCDTIRKYVPILHHYQLTLEDLQRMNWTVVYPPEYQ